MIDWNSTEETRIKNAQVNFFKWCVKNLPVGRIVTQEDIESINRVKESNKKSRDKLFGSSDWVWYLKPKQTQEVSKYACR